ncbi:MAG TPA: methylated-DNA--[protein]-cysteine S-methyltransferase, partial [Gaiellaceae bacterium]|nr:methylated-DNA--[protein]-cysteine S-methyltransferase [Gaiellaceae bacterium]
RRVLRSRRAVERAERQLAEYFAGGRRGFELDVDTRPLPPFAQRVLAELARVPFGTVMNRNPIPIVLPCHRVVGANGSLTGYAGGLGRKEQLLRLEGVLL